MAILTVTTLVDVIGPDGLLSLREAINGTNATINIDDTIVFDPSLAGGTIQLTSDLPDITDELIIDGDIDNDGRPDITITGDVDGDDPLTLDAWGNEISDPKSGDFSLFDDNVRTLRVNGATAEIGGLVITGSDSSGLRLIGGGTATVTGSSISGNSGGSGGGISAASNTRIYISDSIISENEAVVGGGIDLIEVSKAEISRTTISNNTGALFSGGIYVANYGVPGDNSIENSTITGNLADLGDAGGVGVQSGSLEILNSTITGNYASESGGGLAVGSATVNVTNSIILGNTQELGSDNVHGIITNTNSIVTGVDPALVFAQLDGVGGRLADNGGATPTVKLNGNPANPAIDAGVVSALPLDQRGSLRTTDIPGIDNGGMVDLGSVELRHLDLVVTTSDDELDSMLPLATVLAMGGAADLSLREAVFLAENDGGHNLITFDPTVFNGQPADIIHLTLGTSLVLTEEVEIDGDLDNDGRPGVIVSGDADDDDVTTTDGLGNTITDTATNGDVAARLADNIRVLVITEDEARIEGLVITGGNATGPDSEDVNGGGIVIRPGAVLELVASSVSGNEAEEDGGGIGTDAAVNPDRATRLALDGLTVEGNRAGVSGGGIASFFSETRITSSTVAGNEATGGTGGGIINGFGTVELENATLSGNTAVGSGGGLSNAFFGITTIRNSTVTGNSVLDGTGGANSGGGLGNREGLIVAGDEINVFDSIILGNDATSGPEVSGPRITLTDSLTIGTIADIFAIIDGTTGGGGLADNGGDIQTVALLAALTNPAIDASDSPLTTDARGSGRPVDIDGIANGGLDDLGAFEVQPGDVPGIVSIERAIAAVETNADILDFIVTFSEAMDNVTMDDFEVTGGSTAMVSGIAGGGAFYFIGISGGDLAGFNGTVGLQLAAGQDIESTGGGQPLFVTVPPVNEAYILDNIPPPVPTGLDLDAASDSGALDDDDITNDDTPTITGMGEAGTTITLTSDMDGDVGTDVVAGDGTWSIDTAMLSEGDHSFTATATDLAGNESAASAALTVEIDVTAPPAPPAPDMAAASDTGTSDTDDLTMDTTPTFDGTAEMLAEIRLLSSVDGQVATVMAGAGGAWQATATVLAEGMHSITATATDIAGNTSGASPGLDIEIDITPPAPPVVTGFADDTPPLGDGITEDPTLIFSGTALAGAPLEVFLDGGLLGNETATGGGTWDFDNTANTIPFGPHEVTARQADPAGNLSALSAPLPVFVNTPVPPMAVDDTAMAMEDGPAVEIGLTANDTDGNFDDDLEILSLDLAGTLGSVVETGDGDTVSYDPAGAFEHLTNGEAAEDTFSYTVTDGLFTSTATVTVTIKGQRDPSIAVDDIAMVLTDDPPTQINLVANDIAIDDAAMPMVIAIDTFNLEGSAEVSPDMTGVVFDPAGAFLALGEGEMAETMITYLMSDGIGGTDFGILTIKITGGADRANAPPTANPDSGATGAGGPTLLVDLTGNDTDPEGDPLTVTGLMGGLGSAAISSDGQGLIYDPDGAFDGLGPGETTEDVITYTLADSEGGTDTATVTLTITGEDAPPPPNQPPVAQDDSFATQADTTAMGNVLPDNGMGPDSDPDGDALQVAPQAAALPSGAQIVLAADGGFVYDPADAFDFLDEGETAEDSFTYLLADGRGGTDTATATITITGVAAAMQMEGGDEDDSFDVEDFATPITIDGNGGEDTVMLPGALADFEIDPIDGGFRFTPIAGGAPVDLLDVEFIELDDTTLFRDESAEARQTDLIYQVFLGRMPDGPGLAFWIDIALNVLPLDDVVDFFPVSPEFEASFGDDLTDKEFVEVLYQNALERPGDDAGCAFWTGVLESGALDRGGVGLAFALSEEVQEVFMNQIDDGLLVAV